MTEFIKKNARWIILLAILVGYGFLIADNFLTRPYIWLDEGFKMQLGRNFAEFGKIGIQLVPGEIALSLHNASTGWVLPASLAVFFKTFGTSFFTGRIVSSLYLLGFIVLSYLFLWRMWGAREAVLGSLLLISFSPLYANGKMVLAEGPSLFYLAAALNVYYFWRAGTVRNAALSGFLFGLFAAGKLAFLVLFAAPLMAVGLYFLAKGRISRLRFLWFLLFFIVASLPTAILSILPLISGGALVAVSPENYANAYGLGCFSCQVVENLKLWFTDSTLIHLSALAFVSALALWRVSRNEKPDWPVWAVFFYLLLTAGYFLTSPAVYRYLLPAQVVLLAILPVSAFYLSGEWPKIFRKSFVFFGLVVLVAVQSYHFFYLSSVFEREGPVLFEKYAKENIGEENSVGVINSSLPPVVAPNGKMSQFIRLKNTGITEGANPLEAANENLPDFVIYSKYDSYGEDVAPYEDKLKALYSFEGDFDGIFVFKKAGL